MTVSSTITQRSNADNDAINKNLQDLQSLNSQSIDVINNKNKILIEKNRIQESQLKSLNDKEKILLTRSRMLQVAQDRNSFRTKIMYSLIAVIIVICIITLFIFAMSKKK